MRYKKRTKETYNPLSLVVKRILDELTTEDKEQLDKLYLTLKDDFKRDYKAGHCITNVKKKGTLNLKIFIEWMIALDKKEFTIKITNEEAVAIRDYLYRLRNVNNYTIDGEA